MDTSIENIDVRSINLLVVCFLRIYRFLGIRSMDTIILFFEKKGCSQASRFFTLLLLVCLYTLWIRKVLCLGV